MNPFYLTGDFNGDKKLDYAIAVVERKTGKVGIIIYHHPTSKKCFVIGAGTERPDVPGNDFRWMNAWEVFCRNGVEKGVDEAKTIKLKGDAILALKLESSSGLIYRDGKKYEWYQQR